ETEDSARLMDLRKSDRKIQMLIADGIFVTESLSPFMAINNEYLKFKARILRFIDMFPGKQWHVRQSSGPGGVARAAEETQEGEVNDRGCYEASEISVEEISLMVARSKVPFDDSVIASGYCHSPPCLCHRHYRSYRHSLSRQRYHHRRDIDDVGSGGDCNDSSEDDSGDDEAVENDKNDDGDDDGNDEEEENDKMCLDRLHPRLHQFYDRRSCGSGDVDAEVEVHRTETTTVHPLARTSPIATTAVANPSVVTAMARGCKIPSYLTTILLLSYILFGIADACSSRSTPKPRPPTPTDRPNITFHMYTCPPDYAEWYCLNGATCFTVKIVDSLLYNCLCAHGYIGQRCEFKDLDGSYLPSRQRVMLETASIAGGATIAVFLVVIICIAAYIHCKRKQKELRSSNNCVDTVDGPGRDPELRPFSNRSRSLMVFTAKNSNNSATIEQTRMPNWNCPETESMRMASISENKPSSQ
ncbi:SPITZ protein, partial [Acromyrmex insinuator]